MNRPVPLDNLTNAFHVTTRQLQGIVTSFQQAMLAGLAGQSSSLAMLPALLPIPSGREKGTFLTLDFGGTNVRALLIELHPGKEFRIVKERHVPLVCPHGRYNYIASTTTAEQLFDFLATQLIALTDDRTPYPLGHTFSFPFALHNARTAILLYWSKEIATADVVGNNVIALLEDALARQGRCNIRHAAILNDTVGTLMAAAYHDKAAHIGCICGTGHNTCYLETKGLAGPQYINLESGSFDQLPRNHYDEQLDDNSLHPGSNCLEKSCSGRYLGELLRLTLIDLTKQRQLTLPASVIEALPPYALTGQHLSRLLSDQSPCFNDIGAWLSNLGCPTSTPTDRAIVQQTAALISRRSARFVAATFAAILQHIDPTLTERHTIAIDGSLYEKLPGYAAAVNQALQELLDARSATVCCRLTKDGSGIGAAVAAAAVTAAHP